MKTEYVFHTLSIYHAFLKECTCLDLVVWGNGSENNYDKPRSEWKWERHIFATNEQLLKLQSFSQNRKSYK